MVAIYKPKKANQEKKQDTQKERKKTDLNYRQQRGGGGDRHGLCAAHISGKDRSLSVRERNERA